jgi:hypothetical protein
MTTFHFYARRSSGGAVTTGIGWSQLPKCECRCVLNGYGLGVERWKISKSSIFGLL